jgi:hypothetical protein
MYYYNLKQISSRLEADGTKPMGLPSESIDHLMKVFGVSPDITPFFLRITPQDEADIKGYISKLWGNRAYRIAKLRRKYLRPIAHSMESMFSLYDCIFCDGHSIAFLIIISSYVETKGGTYLDVLKILNKGKDIKHVTELYSRGPDKKLSIGVVCKLFGLKRVREDMKKMDCPRVWDLKEDKVVDNPNIWSGLSCQIVAITHRWGPDEILYKHIVEIDKTNVIREELGLSMKSTDISTMSPKLAKIREELKSQIRYVWMDTLCIDKTNSVELDMSIRSMYRWYSNASFVYLEAFTDFDEWCTRGWTLQEGAAAESLLVSPKHGNSFMELISDLEDDKIYKISLVKPYGYSGSVYWFGLMNSRETTVLEDKVYALIGLLDIDFQTAYGEGERAMDRAYDEIARQKGDVSWLASKFFYEGMSVMQELHNRSTALPCSEIQITSTGIKLDAMLIEYKSTTIGGITTFETIYKNFGDIHCWIPSSNVYVILHDYLGYTGVVSAKLDNLGEEYIRSNKTITINHRFSPGVAIQPDCEYPEERDPGDSD